MKPYPKSSAGSPRRAARLRGRIVFFLVRRALRRLAARLGNPAARGGRTGITLAIRHS
jgi:hypothetical protein